MFNESLAKEANHESNDSHNLLGKRDRREDGEIAPKRQKVDI